MEQAETGQAVLSAIRANQKKGAKALTDSKELTNRIKGAGYTFEDIATLLGITRQSLDNKINNRVNASGNISEFKQGEIVKLRQLLGLNLTATNAIFFNVK